MAPLPELRFVAADLPEVLDDFVFHGALVSWCPACACSVAAHAVWLRRDPLREPLHDLRQLVVEVYLRHSVWSISRGSAMSDCQLLRHISQQNEQRFHCADCWGRNAEGERRGASSTALR